jgi:hypothetical protein
MDEGVRSLVRISQSSGGREFLNNLGRGEAGLCIELLDRVRRYFALTLALSLLNHATGTDEIPARESRETIGPYRPDRTIQTPEKTAGLYHDN